MSKDTMKRFNANKVRALGNLQSKSDKQKARLRAASGIKQRWSRDQDPKPASDQPKVSKYLAPVRADYQPPKLRGRSGTRLSASKRAMVARRLCDRQAFFAELGVRV